MTISSKSSAESALRTPETHGLLSQHSEAMAAMGCGSRGLSTALGVSPFHPGLHPRMIRPERHPACDHTLPVLCFPSGHTSSFVTAPSLEGWREASETGKKVTPTRNTWGESCESYCTLNQFRESRYSHLIIVWNRNIICQDFAHGHVYQVVGKRSPTENLSPVLIIQDLKATTYNLPFGYASEIFDASKNHGLIFYHILSIINDNMGNHMPYTYDFGIVSIQPI